MARFYNVKKVRPDWQPKYYRYGHQPIRYAYDWRGRPVPSSLPAGVRSLGDSSLPDSFYTGTYNDELQQSYNVLPSRMSKGTSQQVVDYLGRPGRGRPEPLSPQRYPKWQLEKMAGGMVHEPGSLRGLGLFDSLSDMQKTIGLVAAGSVAAYLFLRKK